MSSHIALWFHTNGIGVFPIRPKSKIPACKWKDYQATPEAIATWTNYGVRLGTLAVLDPDSEEALVACADIMPRTPFWVRTSRGWHFFYRLPADSQPRKFIRRKGQSIELRSAGQYVVGPGSEHESGVVYTAKDWSWRWEDIGIFPVANFPWDDGTVSRTAIPGTGSSFEMPDVVPKSERHETLNSFIASLVTGSNFSSLDADALWPVVEELARKFCSNICQPALPWDAGFVRRSFHGAFKLRERSEPTPLKGITL